MRHLKLLTILLTLTVVIVGIQTTVFAASELEKAAIKEGKVVWYGAWPKKLMDKVAKAFEAKHPKIDVMVFSFRILQGGGQVCGRKRGGCSSL